MATQLDEGLTKEKFLALTSQTLLSLDPAFFLKMDRRFDQEEIEAIFKACNAFWVHSGDPKMPHAELTSGKCSNGYINCREVLSRSNLCQILAWQIVLLLRDVYKGPVDFVVGSDSAALALSKDVANILGAKWHPMQKGPNETQVFEGLVIPEGSTVLHIEELLTTAKTSRAVREGIKKGNPHPVKFVPLLPVLIHRPAPGEGDEVDGSKVIYCAHYDIWAADPPECPLCKAGSKRVKPKGQAWLELTGQKKEEKRMDSTGRIWVALDTGKKTALQIAEKVAAHPAIGGFKVNRLIDQEVFRKDGEPCLFEVLASFGKPIWADVKLHDIPETVKGRMEPYVASGQIQFVTVMAKGGIDMMMAAVQTAGDKASIIAVTELTSLSEEDVHLMSGQPAKASVIQLARNAVLAGVKYLVCSGQELEVLAKRPELASLQKFVPAISPVWSLGAGADQKRVVTPEVALKSGASKLVIGRAIIKAEDPLEAVQKTAAEIEAIVVS